MLKNSVHTTKKITSEYRPQLVQKLPCLVCYLSCHLLLWQTLVLCQLHHEYSYVLVSLRHHHCLYRKWYKELLGPLTSVLASTSSYYLGSNFTLTEFSADLVHDLPNLSETWVGQIYFVWISKVTVHCWTGTWPSKMSKCWTQFKR